ncbi:hypothetical protein STAQ_02970 [Allostella sp. ATCC 35155]|nr:hypothetical protein STAQ_02970 [Stella sp. ATCC 35155]
MTDGIAGFLAMGGYGGFVWGAYGAAAIVLVAILAASIARVAREERALDRLSAGGRRRGRGAPVEGRAPAEGTP